MLVIHPLKQKATAVSYAAMCFGEVSPGD